MDKIYRYIYTTSNMNKYCQMQNNHNLHDRFDILRRKNLPTKHLVEKTLLIFMVHVYYMNVGNLENYNF
jgi:hypothetical protein